MNIIKSIFIAFSMYSQIPVPHFEWKEKDMRYVLCFFPWIGAVIGILLYLWRTVCDRLGVGTICYTLIATAIPLIVTGGFHVDGFMDTMDALHSWQPKEKKLEILKDSHIGAFAVIMLVLYGMVYIGAFSEIGDGTMIKVICAGFFLARALSGISVVTFPSAKKDGTLFYFAEKAHRTRVRMILILQSAFCAGFMLYQSPVAGGAVIMAAGLCFVYYYGRSKKEFGGITGDTAGYFVVICEVCMAVVAAAANIVRTGGWR